ncbi:mitochondrial inner membrane protease subunit 2 isoform X3 [Hemibagrus wyckioides]|uniref:mitochondrial inner membrane protease subunit 2 isoform X3 n=1 Tax=Hemibagrus wyckioides TaxID=337641 RepID=UPI00266D8731|nr:mitochondrial inner membrane protease subunit 2 isoform X3 [Hemibagrus wyckioides]
MAQTAGFGRKYVKAFVSGFFIAVPVTVTALDRLAYVARVEGASMQPSLNPQGASSSDVVLLNRWSVRNYEVQRGDIVSVVREEYKRLLSHAGSDHYFPDIPAAPSGLPPASMIGFH